MDALAQASYRGSCACERVGKEHPEKYGGRGGEQETNKCKLKINGVGQVVNIRVAGVNPQVILGTETGQTSAVCTNALNLRQMYLENSSDRTADNP